MKLYPDEVQAIEAIAKGWARVHGHLRVGAASALLLRMGLHHLETCRHWSEAEQGVDPRDLRDHGLRFVTFIKGMRTGGAR